MSLQTIELGNGITCIDTGYTRPSMTACYLVEQDGRAAFIETGVNNNVDGMLALLDQKGIPRDCVDYIMPTHVHLDHAGGAGRLMHELPDARLVIHPRGARHMIDPARLIEGTRAVYGDEKFEQLYGELLPVPADRVIEAPDNFSLQLAGRGLLFMDTPGHARHHYCIYDESSAGIFSGDTFGMSYREFDTQDNRFCFPTTTPVQFDPPALHESIERLLALKPEQVYLTHFGRIDQPARAAEQLHRDIDEFVHLAGTVNDPDTLEEKLVDLLGDYLMERAKFFAGNLDEKTIYGLLEFDIHLNAQGLAIWAKNWSNNQAKS